MTPQPKRKPGRPRNPDPPARIGLKLPGKIRARFVGKCIAAGLTLSEGAREAITAWTEEEPR